MTRPTRLFASGSETILWGEALEAISDHVADSSVDLLFADPPYNIGKRFGNFVDRWESDDEYAAWCEKWIDLCMRKLKPTGSVYVMCSTQSMPFIDLILRSRVTILSRIVWHYDSSGVQAKKYFGSLYEPILFAVKDRANYKFRSDAILVEARTGAKRRLIDYRKAVPTIYNDKKVPGNVWYYPRVRYRMPEYEEHPSQKPEALLERIILASTDQGDLILDPFAGTFTTSAVAKRLGRQSIAVEAQRPYVKIGLRRLSMSDNLDGEPLTPMTKSTGRRRAGVQQLSLLSTESLEGADDRA